MVVRINDTLNGNYFFQKSGDSIKKSTAAICNDASTIYTASTGTACSSLVGSGTLDRIIIPIMNKMIKLNTP